MILRMRNDRTRVAVSFLLTVVLSLLPFATLYASASGSFAFCGELTSDARQQMAELWRDTPLEKELPHPAGQPGGDMPPGHCSLCTLSQAMVSVAEAVTAPAQLASTDSLSPYADLVDARPSYALASPRAPPRVLG